VASLPPKCFRVSDTDLDRPQQLWGHTGQLEKLRKVLLRSLPAVEQALQHSIDP
jgi:hypothetical protein